MAWEPIGNTSIKGESVNMASENGFANDKEHVRDKESTGTEISTDISVEPQEHVPFAEGTMDIPQATLDAFGGDELRARVFYEKYALRDPEGRVVEITPEMMWQRVAREMASTEKDEKLRKQWEENFYWLLSDFRFVPGGRILFGAGQNRRATLLNCYYMPIKEDSIEAIFDWCKEAARTYSFGGGVGTDISILRPKGAPVNNSAIFSTGAVSFMDLMSTTTGTIGQAGRRGALMITIAVDHPDVVDFIDVKNDPTRSKVTYANVSVRITDEFMRAVEQDEDFELKYKSAKVNLVKKVKARELWKKIVRSAWASAEPGIIFWDAVKKYSPTEYHGMEIRGFNPCSEQALEDYGNCCLGNVNLSMFVNDAFEPGASIDWKGLDQSLSYSVRFLDNVLDYNRKKHPIKAQAEASQRSRRIGVGFTGFGDMLAKLNLKYDTDEAVEFTDKMFDFIKNIVYQASSGLAKEKGSFPAFDLDTHLSSTFLGGVSEDVRESIKSAGLRNACILTVPPVGSGSILAGTTSGIEPIFALSYYRRSKSLSKEEFKVYHPLVGEYIDRFALKDEDELPDLFVTSHEIAPEMRVRMQAAIQKHIDSCISSTVNLPADISPEDVSKVYFLAWQLGCKGITVYREGSREGILLTEAQAKEQAKGEQKYTQAPEYAAPAEGAPGTIPATRPEFLQGFTEVVKTGYGNLYVTINTHEGKPFEVFVQIGKSGYSTMADAEAIGRLASLALRSGVSVKEVIDQLEGIGGSSQVYSGGKLIMSIPDAIAKLLKKHFIEPDGAQSTRGAPHKLDLNFERCPDCGDRALAFEQGCMTCKSCGYSKCD